MRGADIVVKLRDLRRFHGISQRELARLSRVGDKTISSFETGARIDSLKVSQLRRILSVLCVSESEFFADNFEETLGEASEMRGRRRPDFYARQVLDVIRGARRDGVAAESVISTVREILDERRLASPLRRAS